MADKRTPRTANLNKGHEPTNDKGASNMAATQTPSTGARKVNFAGMGKPVDAATYDLVLDGFKYIEENKTSHTPMYTLVFNVADEGKFKGKKLYRNFMVEGNAQFYFFDALVKLGADPEELAPEGMTEDDEGIDIDAIIKGLIGNHVWGKVSVGEYQGKANNNIDEFTSYAA